MHRLTMRGFAPPALCKGGKSMSPPTAAPVCSSAATTSPNPARLCSSSPSATETLVVNFTNQTSMSNNRFTLTPSANSMWTVADSETGFSIKFREGLFNETQQVIQPKTLPAVPDGVEPTVFFAGIMSAFGDFMAQEHPNIATCDIYARRSALWMLANEKYWVTMAAACNSLLIDFDDNQTEYLFQEVSDYIELDGSNPADLNDAEKTNLLGAISLLSDEEAEEVFNILLAFWHEYYDAHYDTETWARDLPWWPAWANTVIDEMEAENDGETE